MSLGDDLRDQVKVILAEKWTKRDGRVVPVPEDLKLGNDAIELEGTVLYADMVESTALVETESALFAAEMYKCFLDCAGRIISNEGGSITAFDGDRIMAVFIGDNKNTSAVRCGLKIKYAVKEVINPAIEKQYPTKTYRLRHAVGIDTSKLFIARTGFRGSNDLVWVGRAANIAAKLCALREDVYTTWITKDVYDVMHKDVKFTDDKPMWEARKWTGRNDVSIYRSSWWWKVD